MTDNEIIKALEYCINNDCDNCPFDGKLLFKNCLEGFLDHINSQKAEINALIAGQETLQKYIAEKDARIERLEKVRQRQAQFFGEERGQKYERINKLSKAKSEAIKEFAERLKTKAQTEIFCDNGLPKTQYKFYHIEETDIGDLVKEMVGADE